MSTSVISSGESGIDVRDEVSDIFGVWPAFPRVATPVREVVAADFGVAFVVPTFFPGRAGSGSSAEETFAVAAREVLLALEVAEFVAMDC
jgi:hypothetical protein